MTSTTQKPSGKKPAQEASQDSDAPPFGESARSVAEEFVARGADALSGAAGLLQGVERESRTQFRDVSRRMARRLELVEEEEFLALREQVRDLSKRVAVLEGKKPAKKSTRKKSTLKKSTRKKSTRKTTRKKSTQKKSNKQTSRKKTTKKAKKSSAKRK